MMNLITPFPREATRLDSTGRVPIKLFTQFIHTVESYVCVDLSTSVNNILRYIILWLGRVPSVHLHHISAMFSPVLIYELLLKYSPVRLQSISIPTSRSYGRFPTVCLRLLLASRFWKPSTVWLFSQRVENHRETKTAKYWSFVLIKVLCWLRSSEETSTTKDVASPANVPSLAWLLA